MQVQTESVAILAQVCTDSHQFRLPRRSFLLQYGGKAAGFTDAEEVHTYSIADLKAAGFTRQEVQAISLDGLILKAAGSTDAKEVHTAGIADLKAAGFTAQEVQAASFDGLTLKAAGFTDATEVHTRRDPQGGGLH